MIEDWTLRHNSLSMVASSWIPPLAFLAGIAITEAVSGITADAVALFAASAAPTVCPIVAYGFAKSLRNLYAGVKTANLIAVGLIGAVVGTLGALYIYIPPASGPEPPTSLPLMLMYVAYVILVAPVAEEFLLQGYVQTLAQRYGGVFSVIVATAVAATLHIGKEGPFYWYVLLFAWFAYLRLKSNSLSSATTAHVGVSVGAFLGALVRVGIASAA